MNKYRNIMTEYFGKTFDSKKEAEWWLFLRQEEQAGRITDLRTQVKFELIPKMHGEHRAERAVHYIADFTFYDSNGHYHVQDVKSEITRKKPEYIIKRKLMLYRKGISVEEV